ncbi:MAG: hypothetical protein JNL83_08225 [Myxococcales bacterium]|nr:hypothetical protein [Myxococcales bacterium]
MRLVLLLVVATACGSDRGKLPDGGGAGSDDAPVAEDAPPGGDGPAADAPSPDAAVDAFVPDAFSGKQDIRIDCHNTCVLASVPASISVPAGTSFEVNWINVGDTECDVSKVDQFNNVPIILGLEPGTSYHDMVHQWCGSFTGTFRFRIYICTVPNDIPVNCGA